MSPKHSEAPHTPSRLQHPCSGSHPRPQAAPPPKANVTQRDAPCQTLKPTPGQGGKRSVGTDLTPRAPQPNPKSLLIPGPKASAIGHGSHRRTSKSIPALIVNAHRWLSASSMNRLRHDWFCSQRAVPTSADSPLPLAVFTEGRPRAQAVKGLTGEHGKPRAAKGPLPTHTAVPLAARAALLAR